MSRGIHTKTNRGATDEWLTPPDLLQALGHFDLDPCAHPEQPYATAQLMVSPPNDGMAAMWRGRVWLNPPFSETHIWLPKLVEHGNGTSLTAARTEVVRWFWPFIWEAADAVLFLRGRLYFRRPDGSEAGNAGHGSVLAAYGEFDKEVLRANSSLGKFIDLKPVAPSAGMRRKTAEEANGR